MLIPFEANGVDYILEFGYRSIRFYKNHERVMSGEAIYQVTTPYTEDDLETLRYTQNGDYIYLFHKNHPIRTLGMYGETDWRLEDFELKGGPWENMNTTNNGLTISATTGTITITANANIFSADDVGRLIRITCKDTQKVAWQAEKSVSTNQILYSDGKYYQAMFGGTTGTVKPVHTEGTVSDGTILFKYVHAGYGTAKITGYTDAKHVTALVIDNFPDEITSAASDYWELGLIYQGSGYPICGTFFRNRFCFLFDNKGIPTVCLSCSDDYDNFADKDFGEVQATNAITVPLVSDRRNEPCWLVSSDVLFVGTSSAEFIIDSASASSALAPDNVKSQKISTIGSLPITPVKIGAHTLFVTKTGTSIRDIIYSFNTDSYDPIDLSLYGKHLLASGITNMVYQEYPDKVIWFTVKDGRLIGMTFSAEQQVAALHQHFLSGDIEYMSLIHNYNNNLDELWCEIARANGRSIEWVDNGYPVVFSDEIYAIVDSTEREVEETKYMNAKAVYMDSCVEVNRTPTNDNTVTLTGYNHLNGLSVVIMVDGAEQPRQVVEDGTITVKGTSKNIKVGLPIESAFIPQNIYIQGNNGSGVGDVQRIDHVTLMLWRSMGGKIGKDFNSLQDIYFRKTDEKMDNPTPLYTGNKEIPVDMRTSFIKEKGASILIYNDSVFPMNILAIVPHFTTSGNGK